VVYSNFGSGGSCGISEMAVVVVVVVVLVVLLTVVVIGFYSYFKNIITNFHCSIYKVIMSLKKMTDFNTGTFPHCCYDGTRLCSHWRDIIVFIWLCGGSKLVCEDCHHISTVLRTVVISEPL
jgi:hypothetical protein